MMKQSGINALTPIDRFGYFATLIAIFLAVGSVIVAPFSAIRWSRIPFPGYIVEQTLVISDTTGARWSGAEWGLHYPMRVVTLNGEPVKNATDYYQRLLSLQTGEHISIRVRDQDGVSKAYDDLELSRFPTRDLVRLFWLPYFVGLIYLFLGLSIFRLRGKQVAGRAFAYFCACASIVNVLIFNIWTSHSGTAIWTLAVAQLGGALIGLSVLLPKEIPSVLGRAWVRGLAYGVSMLLALWGLVKIYDWQDPWGYVLAWRDSYLYAALGITIFILVMIWRLRGGLSAVERQQVRIILGGGVLAFTPVGVWFALTLFVSIPFNPLVFSLVLLIFPISIAFAMVRYRLWDFDLVIRRTIIYTTLTILLVLIYLLVVIGLGNLFDRYFHGSNLFNVLATLLIVAIFTPLRKFVQLIVDQRFYRTNYKAEQIVQEFTVTLRAQVDLDQLSDDLVRVTQEILHPEFISLWAPESGNRNQNGGNDV